MKHTIEGLLHCIDRYAEAGATHDDVIDLAAALLWFVTDGCPHRSLQLTERGDDLVLLRQRDPCDCAPCCEHSEVPS